MMIGNCCYAGVRVLVAGENSWVASSHSDPLDSSTMPSCGSDETEPAFWEGEIVLGPSALRSDLGTLSFFLFVMVVSWSLLRREAESVLRPGTCL